MRTRPPLRASFFAPHNLVHFTCACARVCHAHNSAPLTHSSPHAKLAHRKLPRDPQNQRAITPFFDTPMYPLKGRPNHTLERALLQGDFTPNRPAKFNVKNTSKFNSSSSKNHPLITPTFDLAQEAISPLQNEVHFYRSKLPRFYTPNLIPKRYL